MEQLEVDSAYHLGPVPIVIRTSLLLCVLPRLAVNV